RQESYPTPSSANSSWRCSGRRAGPTMSGRRRPMRLWPHAGTRARRSRLDQLHLADDRPRRGRMSGAREWPVWARAARTRPTGPERITKGLDWAGSCPEQSHIRLAGSAAAFWGTPGNILIRVFDIAGLAVHAVLRVDHVT